MLTALHSIHTHSVASVTVDYSHQAVFELGVLLCELAVKSHPVLGYPSQCYVDGQVTYDNSLVTEWGEGFRVALARARYPAGFLALVCACVSCDAGSRPSLAQVSQTLSELASAAPECACGCALCADKIVQLHAALVSHVVS